MNPCTRLALPLALLALSPACQRVEPKIGFRGILVLSIDCMRADRLSCYGYGSETTPNIDSIARDGVRFTRCYAQSNWTKPSVASLFTGQYVREHGVTIGSVVFDAEGNAERLDRQVGAYPLPPDIPLLAESMHEAGLTTLGLVENSHLNPSQGFGRGFDFYERLKPAWMHFRSKVQELEGDRPFFAYVHLIGPHDPYDSSRRDFEAYRARFATQESSIDFQDLSYKRRGDLRVEDIAKASALYDAELAYYDGDHVGPMLQWLRESDLYDEMLIIVTADHGEELYDHEGWAHGHALHEEVIRVPLVVKLPRSMPGLPAGSSIDEVVESIDLFPTLCELVDAPGPRTLSGHSLLPLLRGEREVDHGAMAISEHAIGLEEQVLGVAVVEADWKFVQRYPGVVADQELELAVPGDAALFEMSRADPERHNQLPSLDSQAEALRAFLEERLGASHQIRRKAPEMIPLDATEIDDLRSLGYLGDEEGD